MRSRTNLVAIAALLVAAGWAWAQSSTPPSNGPQGMHSHMHASSSPDDPTDSRLENHEKMMAERRALMSDMKAMDARLTDLVSAMNAASGGEKVDAIAKAVTALADQRSEMRAAMLELQTKMMRHMRREMHMGAMSGSMEPMVNGPMMEGADSPESHH